MAIAEAVAAGLPVVTTAAGAVGEWLDPGASVVVPVGDVAALRAAVGALLDRPARRAELRAAALAAGAEPSGAERPGVAEALGRFRRMAPVEVQAVCDLPEPRAHAELWGLALEWRARSQRVLTGRLWELA